MVINRKLRAFIAVPLSEDVLEGLRISQEALRETGVAASFPRISSLHITLKFLGDITPDQVSGIREKLEDSISGFQEFDVEIKGLGAFPSTIRPKVAWAGLKSGGCLERLQEEVEASMRKLGFEPERRRFSPHITLARIKSSRNLDMLEAMLESMKDFDIGRIPVRAVRLYQSILNPEGAVHKVLAEVHSSEQ